MVAPQPELWEQTRRTRRWGSGPDSQLSGGRGHACNANSDTNVGADAVVECCRWTLNFREPAKSWSRSRTADLERPHSLENSTRCREWWGTPLKKLSWSNYNMTLSQPEGRNISTLYISACISASWRTRKLFFAKLFNNHDGSCSCALSSFTFTLMSVPRMC